MNWTNSSDLKTWAKTPAGIAIIIGIIVLIVGIIIWAMSAKKNNDSPAEVARKDKMRGWGIGLFIVGLVIVVLGAAYGYKMNKQNQYYGAVPANQMAYLQPQAQMQPAVVPVQPGQPIVVVPQGQPMRNYNYNY